MSTPNPPTLPAPCRCHDSLAAVSPTHEGHCCFLPVSQTCHTEEVEAWLVRRTAPTAAKRPAEGGISKGIIDV